jgi:small subunit ribosomal protein S16
MAKKTLTYQYFLTIGPIATYSRLLTGPVFFGGRVCGIGCILAWSADITYPLELEDDRKMTVKVRLARAGEKNKPFYRVVVADERAPRDGAFFELLGTYDPLKNPPAVKLKRERIDYWLSKGAKPSQIVSELLKRDKTSA